MTVWIELAIVKDKEYRKFGKYALGKMLFSPVKSQGGRDIYKNMRLVKENDLVLHLKDKKSLVGISKVESIYSENLSTMEGNFPEKSWYFVKLKDFIKFDNEKELAKNDILCNENKGLLLQMSSKNNSMFYDKNLRLHQGAYLSKVPIALCQLINEIYKKKFSENIPYLLNFLENNSVPALTFTNNRKSVPYQLNTILYGPPGTGKTYKLLNEYKQYFEDDNIKRYEFVTFHQSYTYEDFMEGIKPILNDQEGGDVKYTIEPGVFKRISLRAAKDINNNYAIFIDEINRGNIAGIFGELITLIEQDKRKGNENEISTILPYSKESFSVPSNLYIIGTMNTADRSIEALDTALRRRFSFIEVSPDPSLFAEKDFSDDDLNFTKLLISINQRIEILLDRDHIIGHSYFLSVKKETRLNDLQDIFKYKIIPLFEEYFYGDRSKIKMILGSNFVIEESVSKVDLFPLEREYGDIRLEDTSTYKIKIPTLLAEFRAIYDN